MPYLVDGHNLLGQIPGLRLNNPAHRQKLVGMLARFARARRCKMVVLFDGEPSPGWKTETVLGSVRILHSGAGRSADEILLERIRRARSPRDLTLITSDRSLGDRARHLGARRIRVGEFRSMMDRALEKAGESAEKPERPDPEEVDYFLGVFGEDPPDPESRSRKRR